MFEIRVDEPNCDHDTPTTLRFAFNHKIGDAVYRLREIVIPIILGNPKTEWKPFVLDATPIFGTVESMDIVEGLVVLHPVNM